MRLLIAITAMVLLCVPMSAFANDAPMIASGTVTAAGGGPIDGAFVEASWYSDEYHEFWWTGRAYSDFDGYYEVYDDYWYDGPGHYQIAASIHSYETQRKYDDWDGVNSLAVDFALEPAAPIATGTVTEAGSEEAIAGAWVGFGLYDEIDDFYTWFGSATTDSEGAYTLYDEYPRGAGEYEFLAEADDFFSLAKQGTWSGVEPIVVDFALTPITELATGTVSAAEGGVLAGAWVSAEKFVEDQSWYTWAGDASTDGNGTYTIYDRNALGAGDYRFRADRLGYRFGHRAETWDGGEPLIVDFSLPVAVPIASGTVTDAETSGGISSEAHVQASWWDSVEGEYLWTGSSLVEADGTYTVYDVEGYEDGSYEFRASADWYVDEYKYNDWDGVELLTVNFELSPPVQLASGTVTEAGGTVPIYDALVEAAFYDVAEDEYLWTDYSWSGEDGTYALWDRKGFGEGDYEFFCSQYGYQSKTHLRQWDGIELLTVDFELEQAPQLAVGQVTEAGSGDPIEGAYLAAGLVVDAGWEWAGAAMTAADGTYTIYSEEDLGAGSYMIDVMAATYRGDSVVKHWGGVEPILADFQLEPLTPIATGVVTEAGSGDPIEDAYVSAERYDEANEYWEWAGSAYSNYDGIYTVYDVRSHGAGEYCFTAETWMHTRDRASREWDGGDPLVVDFVLSVAPELATGTVREVGSGVAIAEALVGVWHHDPVEDMYEWVDDTLTDMDGTYTLRDLAGYGSGVYQFVADSYGYVSKKVERTWDGGDPLTVDFDLDPWKLLAAGKVTDSATSEPLEDAWIEGEWYSQDAEEYWWTGYAITDSDGEYVLYDQEGYGAGTWRFVTGKWGYANTTLIREWNGGERLTLDVSLAGLEPLAADRYEPDNTASQAKKIQINGDAQQRTFFPAGDQDWAWFDAVEGIEYVIETSGVDGWGSDTYLYLFESDGVTLINENDDWDSYYSRIEWTAPSDMRVLIKVREYDEAIGDYGLTVSAGELPAFENTAPVAVNDAYATDYGKKLTVAAPGVLANDSDADGDHLTAVKVANPANGTLSFAASGGFTYTPKAGFSGTDSFTYRAYDGEDFSGVATVSITVRAADPGPPPGSLSTVIAGPNRYATAIAGSRDAFPSAPAVVIATGENFADALGGAGLAGALKSPLLLTQQASLPSAVASEIGRLKASKAYILGGTSAVSVEVENALKKRLGNSNVIRIAGANRYDTANQVAARTISILGTGYGGDAFIATGANYPDALGASPIAAAEGMPVILADPGKATVTLPAGVKRVWITGGTSVVSPKVETALKERLGTANVKRLAGANRFETAARVATYGIGRGMTWKGVGITTGMDFPDALAAGPVLGSRSYVMLLTDKTSVPAATANTLRNNRTKIDTVHFFGGDKAVPPNVRRDVVSLAK